ncbi:quaternary amine ABC transporter ATP-binding protein [Kurthia gibsonii]|uniref:quaternary amine ABC transporter ATP-binding protein n=1 Tax=Kurthia gibsonii TaxID=33946 RepID=UPI002DB7ADF3|nr:glycine betaine/L-proline ABC transporter ATP-binding protein [Kurthia gibsonii]MEB7771866.1 glycine betaine/L-proline ABC transporter ATP-binding protein [Kurthia gibsonii]
MAKIRVENVSKIFGKKVTQAEDLVKKGKSKSTILKETGATVGVYDASFEVEEGEIFVIMGLSGSGKSTLVRLLNRLIEPTTGQIYINDADVSKMNKTQLRQVRRNSINMVFQNFGLFPHQTILKNTEYGLKVRGVPKEERKIKAEKALENAGLIDFKDQYPKQLSGGMQQRVGLARALANDAEIVLMDEAFSALDPLIRKEMQDELLELQQNMKKTIIFITHDLNEALRIGDRIAIMKDGQIIQIGTGEEILTNPADEYVSSFIEDIDRSKVLTAENIMVKPVTINPAHDGPKMALKRMKDEQVSMVLAVTPPKQLVGYITADDALRCAKEGQTNLMNCVQQDILTVPHDLLLEEVLPIISDSKTPVAVMKNNQLVGVLIRGVVIEALAKETSAEVMAHE